MYAWDYVPFQNRDYKLLYWNPYQSTSNKKIGSDRCVFFCSPVMPGGPDERASYTAAGMIRPASQPLHLLFGTNHSLVVCRLKIWYLVFSAKFLSFWPHKRVNKNRSCARLALIQRAFLQQMCLQLGFLLEVCGRKVDLRKSSSPLVIEQEQSQNLILSLNFLDEFMVKCHEWFNTE